jgi:hypothetical protein
MTRQTRASVSYNVSTESVTVVTLTGVPEAFVASLSDYPESVVRQLALKSLQETLRDTFANPDAPVIDSVKKRHEAMIAGNFTIRAGRSKASVADRALIRVFGQENFDKMTAKERKTRSKEKAVIKAALNIRLEDIGD